MLKFDLSIGNIEMFPTEFPNESFRKKIHKLKNSHYSLTCKSPKNSYQLVSDFDEVICNQLISFGANSFQFFPNCNESIDFDFSLKLANTKAVFEVEKANKEKLLYDILKMHIYIESGAEMAVLICPTNWAHANGTVDLFALAKERFNLCKNFGMIDENKIPKMLIVGFTQIYQSTALTHKMLKEMKSQCKVHFTEI